MPPDDDDASPSSTPLALAAFARLPVPGRAKTRLARSGAGDAGAARFYAAAAEHALAQAAAVRCDGGRCSILRQVHCSEAAEREAVEAWVSRRGGADNDGDANEAAAVWSRFGEASGGAGVRVVPQVPSPDLGERMRAALHSAATDAARRAAAAAIAAKGSTTQPPPFTHVRAMIIGTDVPGLTSGVVERAAEALEGRGCGGGGSGNDEDGDDTSKPLDAIFGPAADGGYYLVGVRLPVSWSSSSSSSEEGGGRGGDDAAAAAPQQQRQRQHPTVAPPPVALFRGVEWSTPTVLQRTLEIARREGLRVDPVLLQEEEESGGGPALTPPSSGRQRQPATAALLPVLRDIDTLDDLRAWLEGSEGDEGEDDDGNGDDPLLARAVRARRRRLRAVAAAVASAASAKEAVA